MYISNRDTKLGHYGDSIKKKKKEKILIDFGGRGIEGEVRASKRGGAEIPVSPTSCSRAHSVPSGVH